MSLCKPTGASCRKGQVVYPGSLLHRDSVTIWKQSLITAGNKLLSWEGAICDALKAIKEYLAIPLSSKYDKLTSGREWLPKILPAFSNCLIWSKKRCHPSLWNVLLAFLLPALSQLSFLNEVTAVPWGFFLRNERKCLMQYHHASTSGSSTLFDQLYGGYLWLVGSFCFVFRLLRQKE